MQLFNFLPNTVSLAAFGLLGVLGICLVIASIVSALIWNVIGIVYVFAWPDILSMWIVIGIIVFTILMINFMTGGTFDFDEIGPGGLLCD